MTTQTEATAAIRAFRTTSCGIVCIVYAHNAGQARYATFLQANDAGFDVSFKDISVRRAPGMDHLHDHPAVKPRTTYSLDFLGRIPTPEDSAT